MDETQLNDRKLKFDSSGDGKEENKKPRVLSNDVSYRTTHRFFCPDLIPCLIQDVKETEIAKVNDNLIGVTFEVVTNDSSDEACSRLIDLKNIFSRQLPKMPKEYIVRLVFDHRHISVAMIRHGRTIGGICYRPYPDQRFGEIAFCAISGTEQLKGYGSILMNQLKRHVQKDRKFILAFEFIVLFSLFCSTCCTRN